MAIGCRRSSVLLVSGLEDHHLWCFRWGAKHHFLTVPVKPDGNNARCPVLPDISQPRWNCGMEQFLCNRVVKQRQSPCFDGISQSFLYLPSFRGTFTLRYIGDYEQVELKAATCAEVKGTIK